MEKDIYFDSDSFSEMKEEKTKLCRFCLDPCDIFQTIEEATKETLYKLQLEIDLSKTNDPIMCGNCSGTLQTWFEFKYYCLQAQGYVNEKLDLREVLCSSQEANTSSTSDSVCRLCRNIVIPESSVSLATEEKTITSIKIILLKYFPEINIDHVRASVICSSCFTHLQACSAFIATCLDVEEKVKKHFECKGVNTAHYFELYSLLEDTNLSSQVAVKTENVYSTSVVKYENPSVNMHTTVGLRDQKINIKYEQLLGQSPQESLLSTPHTCNLCHYRTKRRYDLKQHMLTHKSMSEVITYNCVICDFKTKYKISLSKHLLIRHKIGGEMTITKCHLCSYQTKIKSNLHKHMVVHKSKSEVNMHKCTECSFESKHRDCWRKHKLVHKSVDEVPMSKCNVCQYQTKIKANLRKHMVIHKSSSEVTMHKCTRCSFETKHKISLGKHMLTHKSVDEVIMHKCELCQYQTKIKADLGKHMVVHKSASEVIMHKCTDCDFESKHRDCLRKHKLVHMGTDEVAMSKCHICEYQTKIKANLRKHMVIHKSMDEVVSFECEFCEYRAKRKSCLQKHLQKHRSNL